MGDPIAAQLQPENPHTKESLFPEGWEQRFEQAQNADEAQPKPEDEDSPQPGDESAPEADTLAQEQDETEEQESEDTQAPDSPGLDMSIGQFANATGVTLGDIYGLKVSRDGAERTLGELVDETDAMRQSNAALLKERQELQQQLANRSTQAPMMDPRQHPEVQRLLLEATQYEKAITGTDWSQVDPAMAANQRLDLQMYAQQRRQEAQAKYYEVAQQVQKQALEARAEADRQLRARIPEWSDPQTMATERRAITDMLRAYGYEAHEVETEHDPRLWALMRAMWRGQGQVKAVTEKARKIRKVSRTLSAGSRRPEKVKPSLSDSKRTARDIDKKLGKRAALQEKLKIPLP